ncbi:MAG TPA: Spy/CpxP family protein refolding chaperone [Stellaceae bacterium]|nr:Spy/CpxP family protein refolding chaperone [Stellaceae bacterium]
MHERKTCLSLAMALALTATGAFAADAEHDQHHPATTPSAAAAMPAPDAQGKPMASMPGSSGNMPMMSMMQMMMGQNGMAGHVEGRIAFLKAELKVTDAQQPLWNTVADAMRSNAKAMSGMPSGMPVMGSAATLPDKLAMHEKMMGAHLDGLRKLRAAVEPLYAALNSDQKKTADELMIGPMGIMGMRMM